MTNRYRRINKYSTRYVIELFKNDMEDLGLKIGDFVDISDIYLKKRPKEEKLKEEGEKNEEEHNDRKEQ